MEAHNREIYLYKRLNAQVLGVSMDDPITNKLFAKSLDLQFPLLSNPLPWLGLKYGVYSHKPPFLPDGSPMWFGRRTVIVDRNGIVRYIKNGSPDIKEILSFLLNLGKEFRGTK